MASTPKATLPDDVIQGLLCAICGEDALHVVHMDRLPDYVECGACISAFIMEDGGDRVMYGQIAAEFPQTSEFALRQWAWIEAVDARSREERPVRDKDLDQAPTPSEDTEIQSYASEEPEPLEVIEEPSGIDEWKEVDDRDADDSLAALDFDEPTPLPVEKPVQGPDDVPGWEAVEPDLPDRDSPIAQGEQESFVSSEESEALDQLGAVAEADEQSALDETSEVPGFDWLGGLADEDTPIEGPDLVAAPDAISIEEPPVDAEDQESGLSSEDLDDLFRSEVEPEIETPAFSTEFEPQVPSAIDSEGKLDWDEQEPDLLDDISAEDDSTPPEAWLQEDEEVSGPAVTGFEASDEDRSAADKDFSDDFLSSLRDSAAIPLESQPLEDPSIAEPDQDEVQPAAPSWAVEEQVDEAEMGAMAARMQAVTAAEPEQDIEPAGAPEEELPDEQADQVELPEDVIHFRETDPPPDYRHRVVISGDRVIFPGGECVHCGRTPVKGQLAIAGTLPEGQGMGDRKPSRFQVPLCVECRNRATRKSDEARSARTQSLLLAGIIGMAIIVGALAFNLVDSGEMRIADWLILIILFVVGASGSAIVLLNRVGDYPPPMDAAYVRTTLLIPSETQGLETAFEWRNADYAQRFFEANEANTLGNVTRVKDRLILGNP